jgi:hypothetical protein
MLIRISPSLNGKRKGGKAVPAAFLVDPSDRHLFQASRLLFLSLDGLPSRGKVLFPVQPASQFI